MSFNKITTFKIDPDDVEVIDSELLKTASVKLPDGIEYDPEYLYMKVKAVSAGEFWGDNKNYDYFPEIELRNNYKTFLSAHVFKNHENKKIEAAIGDVITADWNDKMKCVYLLIRVDKRIAPSVVRGYQKGFMTDVSMGCRVDHVICSYCGQKAKTRLDYCDHLKSMKGKIMDNGKKVCEINISPKFHDISVVLNGAERTAKAEHIYMEKTASENNKPSMRDIFKVDYLEGLNKTASNNHYFDSDMEVIASSLNMGGKKELKDTDKIAEFKKNLQCKVIGLAQKSVADKNISNLEEISEIIKLLYTEHWDKKKCTEIADKLKSIAKSNRASLNTTFDQFLKVADFAGIELSPLEIHDIYHEVIDVDTHDLRNVPVNETPNELIDRCNSIMKSHSKDCGNAISAIKTLGSVSDNYSDFEHSLSTDPALKLRIAIAKKPMTYMGSESIEHDIMSNIISELLSSRSNHRSFVMPRIIKISKGEINPMLSNMSHYTPLRMVGMRDSSTAPSLILPGIAAGLIYAAYQNDRVNRFNNGELSSGIAKFAHYLDMDLGFEKSASVYDISRRKPSLLPGHVKASMAGIPLTLSYSALQRSRLNNGEDISSLNRYIAENPGNAAMLQAVITGKGMKSVGSLKPKIKGKASDFVETVMNDDMFKKASIDEAMKDSGYDDNQTMTIKYACTLAGIGMEDKAEELLAENNLNHSDIDVYLKTAEQCFRIEIEKTAGVVKDIATSFAGDLLIDNTRKGSMLASVPGYMIDGIALAGMNKALKSAVNKKEKGMNQYGG